VYDGTLGALALHLDHGLHHTASFLLSARLKFDGGFASQVRLEP
jgi:hypothetical protein